MNGGVPIATADWTDPRFSKAQEQAIIAAAAADPHARIIGLDYAHRPIVVARLGIPREERTYAVQRNGDPTDPKRDPNRASGSYLMETWTQPRVAAHLRTS